MSEWVKDGLVVITDKSIELTKIGRDFSQNLSNIFDKYDPPEKTYEARLETIKKAKEEQAKVMAELHG